MAARSCGFKSHLRYFYGRSSSATLPADPPARPSRSVGRSRFAPLWTLYIAGPRAAADLRRHDATDQSKDRSPGVPGARPSTRALDAKRPVRTILDASDLDFASKHNSLQRNDLTYFCSRLDGLDANSRNTLLGRGAAGASGRPVCGRLRVRAGASTNVAPSACDVTVRCSAQLTEPLGGG